MSEEGYNLRLDNVHQYLTEAMTRFVHTAGPSQSSERYIERRRMLADVMEEFTNASALHPPHHSAHESYAVLLEEVDELWDEVKKKQSQRDYQHMRKECIQVAAMALRFITDVIDPKLSTLAAKS